MSRKIELIHVSKQFGQEQVLRDICHTFAPGQIHGVVGNNGSGKTVLMKCICGFLPASGGKILIDGREVGRDMDFPSDLGIMIETPGFLRRRTGRSNLEILASLQRKISREQIDAAMRRVGLEPELNKPVSQYSLGMRQRLGIAQAIMEEPSLLILDEPMNGLDRAGRRELRTQFAGLRDEGRPILLASPLPQDIQPLCDTVCEMDSGILTELTR